MKYVLLLEQDKKFQGEISEILRAIDPELQILTFLKLEELAAWVNVLVSQGAHAHFPIDTDPAPQVPLVIMQKEQMAGRHISLIKQVRHLFVRRGLCSEEDQTGFVLTSFDDPDLNRHDFEDKAITNVIFKPFDKLILEQHLRYAMAGAQPESTQDVYRMETKVMVEMLKDVDLLSYCEFGMVTRSFLPITIGKVSKYYSDIFMTPEQRYVYAQCINCEKEPDKEEYKATFQYVGVETFTMNHIRRKLPAKSRVPFTAVYQNKKVTPEMIRLWIMDEEVREKVKTILADFLPNMPAYEFTKEDFKNFKAFEATDLVICDTHSFASLSKYAVPEQIIPVSFERLPESFMREANGVLDVLNLNADRQYLKMKLEFIFSRVNTIPWEVKVQTIVIRVGNPVEVHQVSEAGLLLSYYRPISIGAFRRFVLSSVKEPEALPFTSACATVEEKG
ncbi:MAG: hypothetical protein V4736_04865, partial [Bdellovibrionota bacterium]